MKLDSRSEDLLSLLYPDFSDRVRAIIEDYFYKEGVTLRITHGFRSWIEQDLLYQKGRTKPGPLVTNAEPGMSFHNYGLAADVCFKGLDPYLEQLSKTDKDKALKMWRRFGELCVDYGCRWGGEFKIVDMPHVEFDYGLTIEELKDAYTSGKLTGVYSLLDFKRGVPIGLEWKNFDHKDQ